MPLTPELHDLARRVSNWRRWGADDQRGTLNLITESAVKRGVAAARRGLAFSLAIAFDQSGPQWDSENMPERFNPELRTYAVNMTFTGDSDDFTTSDDSFRMGSQAATHLDALAHVGYEGKLWNDTPDTVVSSRGATQLGAEHIGALATRGVLLDVAQMEHVHRHEHGRVFAGIDLERQRVGGNKRDIVVADPRDRLRRQAG